MKVLIIGSSGLLGGKLLDKFSKKTKTLGTYFSHSEKKQSHKNIVHLDVRQLTVVEKFIVEFRPNVVIYCASIPRPDICEENANEAYAVNVEGLKNVVSICASLDLKLVYVSADYVFSGSRSIYVESDELDPINTFGRTKQIAETYLKTHLPSALVIRSGLIYGYSVHTEGRGFVHWVIDSLLKNEPIEVDDSLTVFPILADDIADIIFKLIQKDESGVYHVANLEAHTKFSFASLIAQEYKLNVKLLKIVSTEAKKLPAKRPKEVKLSTDKVKNLLGDEFSIASVEEGIRIHRRQFGCLFRMIYSVRPDMLVAGQNASDFRISVGRALAKEAPIEEVDCVVPIPESGIYSATGLSAESKKPLFFGIIRDYFTEKTLYSSTAKDRHQSLKEKLIPVESVIKGKSIALVDEAVLSGATLGVVIQRLKEVGAREIHVRIPSPVMTSDCTGRILPQVRLAYDALCEAESDVKLTKGDFEERLAKKFGVSSFCFLSTKAFLDSVKTSNQITCSDCFLGREDR